MNQIRLLVLAVFATLLAVCAPSAHGQVRLPPEYNFHPGLLFRGKPYLFPVPVDTSLVFRNKSLWIEVAGDDSHILESLLRDAFSKQDFQIAEVAANAQAKIHFSFRVIFQRDFNTFNSREINRWIGGAKGLLAPPDYARNLSVAFIAGNEFKADSADYKKIFDGFRFYEGRPLFGYMADAPVPGGVYVLNDFIPTQSVPSIFHTGIIMEATFTVDGRTHTAKLWGDARANHLPVVPLLERMFDELFKPYGEDAPKISFPKIKDVPTNQ
jgi:hypothetical protein